MWSSDDVVEWVRNAKGHVDSRLEIRDGPNGRGLFTTADIESHAELIAVPFELIVTDPAADDSPCGTIQFLRRELQRGRCSKFWPWLKSIETVPLPTPAAWSVDELSLLHGLPPGNWREQLDLYSTHCGSADDLLEPMLARAVLLFVTRASVFGFFPVFDLLNHGYNSTVHKEVDDGDVARGGRRAVVYAKQPIASGSELTTQYAPGPGVGRARWESFVERAALAHEHLPGAPEVFRSYGFIEPLPQHWWFTVNASTHAFVLEADQSIHWPNHATVDLGRFASAARYFLDEQSAHDRRRRQLAVGVTGASVDPARKAIAEQYRRALLDAVELARGAADAGATMGTTLATLMHWFEHDHGGTRSPAFTLADSPMGAGLGVIAARDVGASEELLIVPGDACVSSAAALQDPFLGDAARGFIESRGSSMVVETVVTAALLALARYSQGSRARAQWGAYADSLPWGDDEEVADSLASHPLVLGEPVPAHSTVLRGALESVDDLRAMLVSSGVALSDAQCRRALVLVVSRAFNFFKPSWGVTMVPVLDVINQPSISGVRRAGAATERFAQSFFSAEALRANRHPKEGTVRLHLDWKGAADGEEDGPQWLATLTVAAPPQGLRAGEEVFTWYGDAGWGTPTAEDRDAEEALFVAQYGFNPWR